MIGPNIIPDQDLAAVLSTAVEQGVGYWSIPTIQETITHTDYGRCPSVVTLDEYDERTGLTIARHRIDLMRFRKALSEYYRQFKRGFDFNDYDCGDADVLVQLACFKEVKYG